MTYWHMNRKQNEKIDNSVVGKHNVRIPVKRLKLFQKHKYMWSDRLMFICEISN